MTLNDIKAELRRRSITGASIANQLNLSRHTVSVILAGKGKSKRIQNAISKALGMTYDEVWSNNAT